MQTKLQLDASGFIENEAGETEFNAEFHRTNRFQVPLPLFGVRATRYLDNDWTLLGHAKYFEASIGNIDGSILSLRVSTEYQWKNDWHLGLAISHFKLDVVEGKDIIDRQLVWQYTSLNAYVTYQF